MLCVVLLSVGASVQAGWTAINLH